MSIVEAWVDRIGRDLTPFVDPSTTLSIATVGSTIDVAWIQRRRECSARFVIRDAEGVYVLYKGKELAYRAFFASEDMADIAGIAQTSRAVLGNRIYVETRASSSDVPGANGVPALELIGSLAAQRDEQDTLTNFVMVTGEAGAGKTSVLKELVRLQSDRYLSGSSDFVCLYVNAQGRALARFNEALATELNELRVALPHHAVAPLVKMGLIVPVIDGFDELIGVGGYDDAFSSISSFVGALDGLGAIVASARSTYYEQEFLSRTAKNAAITSEAWKLVSVAVEGWGANERQRYVEEKVGDRTDADVQSTLAALNRVFSGENEPLGSKPLFVARTTDFLLGGMLQGGEGALLDRLVDAFIGREQREKLLRRDGGSILNTSQIRSICSDLAEEMWNLGTRELDRLSVKEIAELALTGAGVSPVDQNIVIERIPNMAFLQPGDAHGSVCFEHEIFFDYFLSDRIATSIADNAASLPLLLGRSAMPESLADSVAKALEARPTFELEGVILRLTSVAMKHAPRQQLVRENAGQIVGRLVVNAKHVQGILVRGLIFPGSTFHGVEFTRMAFEECEFRRCDLTATLFLESTAVGLTLESPLIDGATRLEIVGLELPCFAGIRTADDEGGRIVYDPREMSSLLRAAGLPALQMIEQIESRRVDAEAISLVERIARAYAKCNPICVQDDYLRAIFSSSLWPQIQRIAVEAGIVKLETRAANGPRRDFVRRLVRTEDLLAGLWRGADVPPEVDAFWRRMESEFPAE